MRSTKNSEEVVKMLADAFFANDPYYPRPRAQDKLYKAFRAAYMVTCSESQRHLAGQFLSMIETHQAERDARGAPY